MRKLDFYDFDEYCRKYLKANQERVYKALLSFKNRKDIFAFPSQDKLAERCRLSVRTIIRAIKVLRELGFLKIHKMKAIIGHYNKYEMLIVPEVKKKTNKNTQNIKDNIEEHFDSEVKDVEIKGNYIYKVLENTRIKKVSNKQKDDINSFGVVVINQTLAKIKAKKIGNPKYANLFIDQLVDTAVELNCLQEWQMKKFKVLLA